MSQLTLSRPLVRSRPPKTGDYISYSAISTFQTCPLKYFFRYVDQLPEDVIPASLLFGSAIHGAVQFHFEQVMAGRPPPDREILLDVFQAVWSERADKDIVFPRGENFASLCSLAERMLCAFQQTGFSAPKGEIIGVEEELRGVIVPGLPDLLAAVSI